MEISLQRKPKKIEAKDIENQEKSSDKGSIFLPQRKERIFNLLKW